MHPTLSQYIMYEEGLWEDSFSDLSTLEIAWFSE